jgi:hypothetical protein
MGKVEVQGQMCPQLFPPSDLQPGPKRAPDAQFDLHIIMEVSLLHRTEDRHKTSCLDKNQDELGSLK